MLTLIEQPAAIPADLTAEQDAISRRLLEAVGWQWLRYDGIGAENGYAEFHRPGTLGKDLHWQPVPCPARIPEGAVLNLFRTTQDAAGYEAAYWRDMIRKHLFDKGRWIPFEGKDGVNYCTQFRWAESGYTEHHGESGTYPAAFPQATDAALSALQAVKAAQETGEREEGE